MPLSRCSIDELSMTLGKIKYIFIKRSFFALYNFAKEIVTLLHLPPIPLVNDCESGRGGGALFWRYDDDLKSENETQKIE